MKKYILSIFAAATLMGFSACDDGDYADWAVPMTAEQEEIAAAVEAAATPVTTTINWANELGETVKVVDVTATAGYDVRYELAFTNGTVLAVDENGCVKTEELKKVIEAIYGKAPSERIMEATLVAYITVGDVTVKKEIPVTFNAQLTAPHIAESYYIIGAPQGWSNAADAAVSVPFLRNSDQSVYDDPIFTVTFPAAETGDTWFAILPGDQVDAFVGGDWKVLLGTTSGNGKNGEEGMLASRSELEDDGSFCVAEGAKFIKVELNMLDGTYKVTPLNFEKFVYVPGNAQGWNPASAGRLCSANYDGIYTGFVYVDGGFKFTSQADWDGTNYGAGAAEGTVSATGGDFDWGTGVFYVSLNLQDMSYSATKVEKMGLIGDFNSWGGDVELTWNAAKSCYEGDASAVTANGWKFRVNADWAINLGGKNLADLTENGANLSETGSLIELFPLRLNGVSETIYGAMDGNTPLPPTPSDESSEYLWTPGNANGWNHAAASRLYSAEKDGCYEGFIYANGGFKFTDQADWNGTNFGAGEEGKLSTDGGAGDLSLEEGVYYVKVDINELTYTATKIESMSMIGDFNGWNADAALTWNAANLCFEGDASVVTAAGWKFRANSDWAINLGGTADNLSVNGDNLFLTGSTVKLYPCRVGDNNNIYCTVE